MHRPVYGLTRALRLSPSRHPSPARRSARQERWKRTQERSTSDPRLCLTSPYYLPRGLSRRQRSSSSESPFLRLQLRCIRRRFFRCGGTPLRVRDDVIELNFVVPHWFPALLTYLTVSAHDFEHHVPRNIPAYPSAFFRFGE